MITELGEVTPHALMTAPSPFGVIVAILLRRVTLARTGGVLRTLTVLDFIPRQGVPSRLAPWTEIARRAREGHRPSGDPSLATALWITPIAQRRGEELDRAGTVCLVRCHDRGR